ncbi:MAG: hypothetical protein K0U20_07895 [Proteobacteria bacterium]|nr:hypothetical protein [Pseudomonadota bacterium]
MIDIVEEIYKKYEEEEALRERRGHLGASQIGERCSRKLWYGFRNVADEKFNGMMLKLFMRGHREEPFILEDLKKIGIKIKSEQKTFREFGHFGGSCDGIGEFNGDEFLLELKTSNTSGFKKIKKSGVYYSKYQHYVQMQTYMHAFNLSKALYLVVCKETDELYTEWVEYDKVFAVSIFNKAKHIIESDVVPPKIGLDESSFECRFCAHKKICWNNYPPQVNCRTCLHSTPIESGKWNCEVKGEMNDEIICDKHLYNINLIDSHVLSANKQENYVVYKDFQNGGDGLNSFELFKLLEKRYYD